jgi:hypothetical protein
MLRGTHGHGRLHVCLRPWEHSSSDTFLLIVSEVFADLSSHLHRYSAGKVVIFLDCIGFRLVGQKEFLEHSRILISYKKDLLCEQFE